PRRATHRAGASPVPAVSPARTEKLCGGARLLTGPPVSATLLPKRGPAVPRRPARPHLRIFGHAERSITLDTQTMIPPPVTAGPAAPATTSADPNLLLQVEDL